MGYMYLMSPKLFFFSYYNHELKLLFTYKYFGHNLECIYKKKIYMLAFNCNEKVVIERFPTNRSCFLQEVVHMWLEYNQ
jgi:hypothetical protein